MATWALPIADAADWPSFLLPTIICCCSLVSLAAVLLCHGRPSAVVTPAPAAPRHTNEAQSVGGGCVGRSNTWLCERLSTAVAAVNRGPVETRAVAASWVVWWATPVLAFVAWYNGLPVASPLLGPHLGVAMFALLFIFSCVCPSNYSMWSAMSWFTSLYVATPCAAPITRCPCAAEW